MVSPWGGPENTTVALTFFGSNFADYGGVACSVDGVPIAGALLSASRALCVLLAMRAGQVEVRLSLANGEAGSWTEALPFLVYRAPTLRAVAPAGSDANGGTLVTVSGSSFLVHPSLAAHTSRCQFGGLQSAAPLFLNDTHAACVTPAGSGAQVVAVAPYGRTFLAGAVRFAFAGLRRPSLLDAHFAPDGGSLVLRFDGQPNNRAGMAELQPCGTLLDAQTVEVLQGAAAEPPLCGWLDDSTLTVRIDALTALAYRYSVASCGWRTEKSTRGAPRFRASADSCGRARTAYATLATRWR